MSKSGLQGAGLIDAIESLINVYGDLDMQVLDRHEIVLLVAQPVDLLVDMGLIVAGRAGGKTGYIPAGQLRDALVARGHSLPADPVGGTSKPRDPSSSPTAVACVPAAAVPVLSPAEYLPVLVESRKRIYRAMKAAGAVLEFACADQAARGWPDLAAIEDEAMAMADLGSELAEACEAKHMTIQLAVLSHEN